MDNQYQELDDFFIDKYNDVYLELQNRNCGLELLEGETEKLEERLKENLNEEEKIILNKLIQIYKFQGDIERQLVFIHGTMKPFMEKYMNQGYINRKYIKSVLENILYPRIIKKS